MKPCSLTQLPDVQTGLRGTLLIIGDDSLLIHSGDLA